MIGLIGKAVDSFGIENGYTRLVVVFKDSSYLIVDGEPSEARIVETKEGIFRLIDCPITYVEEILERSPTKFGSYEISLVFWSGPVSQTFVWNARVLTAGPMLHKVLRTA